MSIIWMKNISPVIWHCYSNCSLCVWGVIWKPGALWSTGTHLNQKNRSVERLFSSLVLSWHYSSSLASMWMSLQLCHCLWYWCSAVSVCNGIVLFRVILSLCFLTALQSADAPTPTHSDNVLRLFSCPSRPDHLPSLYSHVVWSLAPLCLLPYTSFVPLCPLLYAYVLLAIKTALWIQPCAPNSFHCQIIYLYCWCSLYAYVCFIWITS